MIWTAARHGHHAHAIRRTHSGTSVAEVVTMCGAWLRPNQHPMALPPVCPICAKAVRG